MERVKKQKTNKNKKKQLNNKKNSLGTGVKQDEDYKNHSCTIDTLSESPNPEIVFEFSKWVMEKDSQSCMKIFNSTTRNGELPIAQVEDFLKDFGVDQLISYYEHLIFTKKIEDEIYHEKLSRLYMNLVIDEFKKGFFFSDKI